MKRIAIAVVSWGSKRLDIFGLGNNANIRENASLFICRTPAIPKVS
jgi:hypothetical protein